MLCFNRILRTSVLYLADRSIGTTTTTITTMTSSSSSSSSSPRLIEKVVPATNNNNGHLYRLIGDVDIDGKGTNHPLLPQVDPFILLDYAILPKNNLPPFGAHPHRGHSVITINLNGKVNTWDSFSNQKETLTAPCSYWVDAGSGVFHDETSFIEDENDPTQHWRIFQLWVGVKEEDRKKPPRVQAVGPLPQVTLKDNNNISIGKIIHYAGPTTNIETPHPVCVAHIQQNKNTTYRHPVDPTHDGAFVVHVSGKPSFSGTTPDNDLDVLVLKKKKNDNDNDDDEGNNYIEIITTDDNDAEYLVCTGEPTNEKWFKKLVADGAVITATEEEARELVPKVEAMSAAGLQEGGSFAPFGSNRKRKTYDD